MSGPLYISSFQPLLYFYFCFLSVITNVTFYFWFLVFILLFHHVPPFKSKFFLIAFLLHSPPVSHQLSFSLHLFSCFPAFVLPICTLIVHYYFLCFTSIYLVYNSPFHYISFFSVFFTVSFYALLHYSFKGTILFLCFPTPTLPPLRPASTSLACPLHLSACLFCMWPVHLI